MPFSLNDHEAGCTPLQPCYHCKVASFLREHLEPETFAKFLALTEENPSIRQIPLDAPVANLAQFSVRTENCLRNDRIITVEDLVRHTEAKLLRIPNFGHKGLLEVKAALAKHGRTLGELPWEPRVVGGTS
jgi:DNA-directed RNA polymerase alpha subunit